MWHRASLSSSGPASGRVLGSSNTLLLVMLQLMVVVVLLLLLLLPLLLLRVLLLLLILLLFLLLLLLLFLLPPLLPPPLPLLLKARSMTPCFESRFDSSSSESRETSTGQLLPPATSITSVFHGAFQRMALFVGSNG